MIDIKLLREQTEWVRQGIARKKFSCDLDQALQLDADRRRIITETEQLRAQQKSANTEMAQLPKGSEAFLAKVKEMKELAAEVKALQARQAEVEAAWEQVYMSIPNIPDVSVPDGHTEDDNVVAATWGDIASVSPHARPHYELPWFSEFVDLQRGTKITGAGFPVFIGDVARMVRGLIQFFLNENTAAGYLEMMPPYMVNPASATATGQLPDKEGQMYHVAGDDLYLIPTAEVPVTNYFRDEVLSVEQLPLKICGYSPCFRREAGSYGKDVRGLNRVHQFDKVELVKWVLPETSMDELESLRRDAESLIEKLGLPYRTLLMCAGDIGFPHAKQYDLEVWSGGQKRWLEVSSCSCFTDFQARRANIRYREGQDKPKFVHTLNGSALAIPRVLAAILENNLREDGRVTVPEALRPYVGKDVIGPVS